MKTGVKNADFNYIINADTIINTYRIDSIHYVIRQKDSVIVDIQKRIEYEKVNAGSIDDDSAVGLFKQLVTN